MTLAYRCGPGNEWAGEAHARALPVNVQPVRTGRNRRTMFHRRAGPPHGATLCDKTSSKGFQMAIGWLAVLKSVPWPEVVSNAPVVAEGARKLWNAVARKSAPILNTATDAQAARSPEAQAISALESRVSVLEAAAADLQDQMIASSDLIKALADQNTQLIRRIEIMRIRVLWLAGALAVAGFVTVATAVWALMR